MNYNPPYTITNEILDLIVKTSEALGALKIYESLMRKTSLPHLKKNNPIKTIQSTLAIEQNTLTLEQVTAVINGEKVAGNPREILEVQNAFRAYNEIDSFNPSEIDDFLKAHKILMKDIIDECGSFRKGGVAVAKGDVMIHLPPPAKRVPSLMNDLFNWFSQTDIHPLLSSSIVHYEIEFIHPFSDGNGRMGRLWQTVILKQWKDEFSGIPLESVIKRKQQNYYAVLKQCDEAGNSTLFIEFILTALIESIEDLLDEYNKLTEQATEQATEQVVRLILALKQGEGTIKDLMDRVEISHRPTFLYNYIHPALEKELIEMAYPDKPKSPNQKYRLTRKGMDLL
jgi:Fic family protein